MTKALVDSSASAADGATVRPAWRATSSLDTAMAVGLALAALGVLASRVDVVLLAVPLLLSAAVALDRRPAANETTNMRLHVAREDDGKDGRAFAYRAEITTPASTEYVHVRLTRPGSPRDDLLLAPRTTAVVNGRAPVLHSGRQTVVELTYRLIGVEAAWRSRPTSTYTAERVVDPAITAVGSLPLPHRLTGINGAHRSARPGDGGEFRDLHPYAPGDRLRRIDWKATARRSQGIGDLYVRRTDATADATVVLVMDSRDDVGEHLANWSTLVDGDAGLTAMDVAREAAASVAAAAISAGDRVSLIDLAAHHGLVVAGSGKRHLDRLLRRIADSGVPSLRLNRRRAPIVPAGAIVYLLTTFLDDEAQHIALWWRAAGHRVIAIDVLPSPLLLGARPQARLAHRLLMAQRRQRIAVARAHGVELLRWQEDHLESSRVVTMRARARAGQRRR